MKPHLFIYASLWYCTYPRYKNRFAADKFYLGMTPKEAYECYINS